MINLHLNSLITIAMFGIIQSTASLTTTTKSTAFINAITKLISSNVQVPTPTNLSNPSNAQVPIPLSDCLDLLIFARGLGMQSAQPGIWSSLQGNCCSAGGVTCVNNRVDKVDWNTIGLTGIINGSAMPNALTGLFIYNNQLTGSVPSVFPINLTYLDISSNLLSGSIPPSLPNTLIYLNVRQNQFTGDLPIFPFSLTTLLLSYPGYLGNRFTGTLHLMKPVQVYINDNWISDIIIQDISALRNCNISNNPLLGNLNIANLTMCTQNGLYNASLLPNTQITSMSSTVFKTQSASIPTSTSQLPANPSCVISMPTPTLAYFGNNNDLHVLGTNLGNPTCTSNYQMNFSNTTLDFPFTYTSTKIVFTIPTVPANTYLNILSLDGHLYMSWPIINPFVIVNSFVNKVVAGNTQTISFNLNLQFSNLLNSDLWHIDPSNSLYSSFNKKNGLKLNSNITLSLPLGYLIDTNVFYTLTSNLSVIPGYIHFTVVNEPVIGVHKNRNGVIKLLDNNYEYLVHFNDLLTTNTAIGATIITNTFDVGSSGLVDSVDMPPFSKHFDIVDVLTVGLIVDYPRTGTIYIDNVITATTHIIIGFNRSSAMSLSANLLLWKYTNNNTKLTISDFQFSLNTTFQVGKTPLKSITTLVLVCSNDKVPNVFGKKRNNVYPLCDICPIGSTCSNSGDNYPIGLPGYYPTPSSTGEFLFTMCIPEVACTGTINCNKSYSGNQCGSCAPQYYRIRTVECTACNSNSRELVLGIGIIFVISAILFLYIKMTFGAFFVVIGIGLRYVQSYYIYQSLLLKWSGHVQEMFHYMSFLAFNIDLTSPECFNPEIDYFYKAKIVIQSPLIFLVGLISVALLKTEPFNYPFVYAARYFGIKNLEYKTPTLSTLYKNLGLFIAAFHILIQLLFVTICTWIMGYYACVQFGNKIVMVRSPADECYTGKHLENAHLFYGATLIYVIGIPLYFCALFQFKTSDSESLRNYANTVLNSKESDFTESGMIMIAISLVLRVFMIASATFLNNVPVLQAIVVMACCIIQMSFLIHLKPYKNSAHTTIDICTQAASIITLNCGILFYIMLTTKYGDIFNKGLTTTVIAATGAVILVIVIQVLRDFKKAKTQYSIDKKIKKLEKMNKKVIRVTPVNNKKLESKNDRLKAMKETMNHGELYLIEKAMELENEENRRNGNAPKIRSNVIQRGITRVIYDDLEKDMNENDEYVNANRWKTYYN